MSRCASEMLSTFLHAGYLSYVRGERKVGEYFEVIGGKRTETRLSKEAREKTIRN